MLRVATSRATACKCVLIKYAGIGKLGTKGTTVVGCSPEGPSYRLPRMSQEDLDETPSKF